jgi:hypothetical protein
MKTWIGVLLVIATILTPPLATKVLMPADGTTNDIFIGSVSVVSGGVVVVSGTFDVATGYTLSSVTVDVMPTGGVAGQGGEAAATTNGNGYGVGIGVPNGTYDVQATLAVTDSSGNPYYFFSDSVTNVVVDWIPPG